jgi:protein-disulfide isomerase
MANKHEYMNLKKMILIFVPALAVAGFALFVQILHYEPLFPEKKDAAQTDFTIPFSPTDPIIGVKRASKTIVAFEDFGCHSCKQYDTVLMDLVAAHPTVKVIWKGIPVTRYPYPTDLAIKYAFCAHAQKKFIAFKNEAFALNDQLSDEVLKKIALDIKLDSNDLTACLADTATENYLEQSQRLATTLGIQTVPTVRYSQTVFANNLCEK